MSTVKARNVVAFRNTGVLERKVLMSTVSVQVDAQVPRGNVVRTSLIDTPPCLGAGRTHHTPPRVSVPLLTDHPSNP